MPAAPVAVAKVSLCKGLLQFFQRPANGGLFYFRPFVSSFYMVEVGAEEEARVCRQYWMIFLEVVVVEGVVLQSLIQFLVAEAAAVFSFEKRQPSK